MKQFLSLTVCLLLLGALMWEMPAGNHSQAQPSAKPLQRPIRTGADAATFAARDLNHTLVQIPIYEPADRQAALALGTLIEDYGSFVVMAVEKSAGPGRAQLETTINLVDFSFEPLRDDPARALAESAQDRRGLHAPAAKGGDYYIVQFAAPVRDEWLAEMAAAGGEVLQYIPHQAFFVYASPQAMATIGAHPRVRWTGVFQPVYKVAPPLQRTFFNQADGGQIDALDVAIFKLGDLDGLADWSAQLGARTRQRIILPNNYFNVLRIEASPALVPLLAQFPGVVRIDPYIKPSPEDERAAQIIAGNFSSPTQLNAPGYNSLAQFGVDGTNVTVSVVDDGVGIPGDGGFYITANNTVNGPLRGAAAGALGHGHLNASIIAGDLPFSLPDLLGYNFGLGVARKAQIINIPFLRSGYSGSEADTVNDTVTTTGPNGVPGFITNNSWGAGTNGNAYDSLAAQYDGFVRDASFAATIDPLCIVFSAGNSGASGLTRPKAAKNVIATANAENIRPELSASANNIDDLSSTSSRGPAADGRVKPDISAPGTAITGGRSGTDVLFGNLDLFHRWSSGTSHAAPQIAGAAALFTQFWKNNHGGNNPSPALVKAALINGTQEMNGVGTLATVPNGAEGWGRLNLQNVLNTGVPIHYVNQTDPLRDIGDEFVYTGAIANAARQVRVSLVWTDPPGIGNPALINNLDLEVTIGGTLYRGNNFVGGSSAAGSNADTLNNVENVFLPAGGAADTPVTIRVRAAGLNGDGILTNNDATDQHFALVVFNFNNGAGPTPARAKKADFDGDGKTDLSVWRGNESNWLVIRSSNGALQSTLWGAAYGPFNDVPVPGDYDGDGRTDVAIFRRGNGTWYIVRSSDDAAIVTAWGFGTDEPVPGDYDGDGKTDIAVWRGETSDWLILKSSNGQPQTFSWGTSLAPYNDVPVAADYDGDGKTDVAVFRRLDGTWYILRSSNDQPFIQAWGLASDVPVPGDYDGDGKCDIAVWRGFEANWFILRSSNFQPQVVSWGTAAAPYNDVPVPGDYDGDGKTDVAIWRPFDATWYVIRSSNSSILVQAHGQAGDTPVPATGSR